MDSRSDLPKHVADGGISAAAFLSAWIGVCWPSWGSMSAKARQWHLRSLFGDRPGWLL
jgi:hypothetical protein